jgi:septum site-determining protein MinD
LVFKEFKMSKVYAVISGKGGVGKTTAAINLGTTLNYLGEDVTVVDANLSTPNIGIHLGAPIVPINLNHILNNQANLEDAIYEHEDGMKVMPASLSLKDAKKANLKKLPKIIKNLKKITNHILIDCAAGLGREAKSAIKAADEILIVTNPEMSAVTDALKTIKLAQELNKPVKGVIITRYKGNRLDMSISNIKDMLEIPILGIIPEDINIRKSHILKNPVFHTHPKSRASRTFLDTSRRLLGEELPMKIPGSGFWGFFRR